MTATSLARRLLSRSEAATYLGVSLKTFQERVQPELAGCAVWIGNRILFDVRDLDEWVDTHKGGSSDGPATESVPRFGSGTVAGGTNTRSARSLSPEAAEISARLKKPPRNATPRLYPVGDVRKPRGSGPE